MMRWAGLLFAGMMGLASAPASAQDLLDPHPLAGVVDELRIGLNAHDVHHAALPFLVGEWRLDRIEDVSFDVLFASPDLDAFRWIGAPRPEIGATLNLGGQDSLVHANLTWQLPVFDTPLYLEAGLGVAVHDGALSGAAPGRKNFGCRINFYERWGVGMQVSDQATATLTYEHTSNNGWCDANDGLSNVGLRLGWKF
ncbi:acyloxyacyl hydrolase [Devosia sp. YIM 151766]|uniref:acyloxyacyl hydrolase n=1 Tax=Devosia sp. YIM 151766 TaxID=3017325 RepID=UPI00255CDE6D|nr:acyloxyacyl hydrolase [Devosia sp. YIM 151766]WIY52693.1 acyloxyacyl hydrolase [Devosia sp. YIM 151766]